MLYFADGHEMATLNATKLLLLTKQPKLTITVTLTLTDTVMVIFFTRVHRMNERNFSRRAIAGFVVGPIFFTCLLMWLYSGQKTPATRSR